MWLEGIKNQVDDHLSRLKDEALLDLGDRGEINDMLTNKKILDFSHDLILSLLTLLIIWQAMWYL